MVIVIIHWKIHPNEESRQAFFKNWEEKLTIEERSHLVGEYLSEPMPSEQVGFPCVTFNTPSSPEYQSFFNVGIWEDVESFKRQIIDPYVGNTPRPAPFEYELRERMILGPLSWRAGKFTLPTEDHFV
jgi:hypothetical protein